jgi:hypothetical protein
MIEIILLTSLFSFGLYVTTHHPYLLYPVRYFIGIILLDGKEDFEMDSAGQVTRGMV